MTYSFRLKGFFLGWVIGFALTARLAFALPIGLFGRLGGLADYANELAILVALLAASRLTNGSRAITPNEPCSVCTKKAG